MQSLRELRSMKKEWRLTNSNNQRGEGLGPCHLWGGLDKLRHYSPNRLVSESAKLQIRSAQGYKRTKRKTFSLLDDRWVILTTSKAFHYFWARRDENSLRIWSSLVCRQDQGEWSRSRPGEWFLLILIIEVILIFIVPNFDRNSVYDLKHFPNVFRSLWYMWPCVNNFGLITFWTTLSTFWNYFVWLRITDEGSVPEMRIWSILLIQSDCKMVYTSE